MIGDLVGTIGLSPQATLRDNMGRALRRAIVWGTMVLGEGKRRRYLFRIDPRGILAIRVGNPLSWSTFFVALLLSYIFMRATPLGPATLLVGGALGMLALGSLDRALARAVASQPQEEVLKSPMNLFLPRKAWDSAEVEDLGRALRLRFHHGGREARITISRPRPTVARQALEPLLSGE